MGLDSGKIQFRRKNGDLITYTFEMSGKAANSAEKGLDYLLYLPNDNTID